MSEGGADTDDPGARPGQDPELTLSAERARELRMALLSLHKALLEDQREQVERQQGQMTGAELLQAATDDLRFSWLRELSGLMVALDVAREEQDGAAEAETLAELSALVAPPRADTPFGWRYLQALQERPDVVLAHRDVVRLLSELPRA